MINLNIILIMRYSVAKDVLLHEGCISKNENGFCYGIQSNILSHVVVSKAITWVFLLRDRQCVRAENVRIMTGCIDLYFYSNAIILLG